MTTRPTVHPATPAATGIHQGMPTRPGTRAARAGGARRRALIAALGLAVAAAVLPAGAAAASPQAPEVDTQLHEPRRQPAAARAARPAGVGAPGRGQPDREPRAAAASRAAGLGTRRPGQPDREPRAPLPPEDPDPAGDGSFPTPDRVDAGFGGAAAGPHQAAGLALIAAAVMLALLFAGPSAATARERPDDSPHPPAASAGRGRRLRPR